MSWRTKLSARQQRLLKQLDAVVKVAQTATLPRKVLEMQGFGSFFRGKSNAKDVDIRIKFGDMHPYFQYYRETITKMYRTFIDIDNPVEREKFPAPKDFFDATYLKVATDLGNEGKDAEGVKGILELFSSWLEGITWAMIRDREYTHVLDASTLTERLLKHRAHARNVSVSSMTFSLITDTVFTIWSPDSPDYEANLGKIFDSDRIRQSRLASLREFLVQIAAVTMQEEVLSKIIALTIDRNYCEIERKELPNIFPQLKKEWLEDLYTVWNHIKEQELNEAGLDLALHFDFGKYEMLSDIGLEEIVEQKRMELKDRIQSVTVMQHALSELNHTIHASKKEGRIPHQRIAEYVALFTLEAVNKTEAPEDKIRDVLRRAGFPEDKVETLRQRGERTGYRLKDED